MRIAAFAALLLPTVALGVLLVRGSGDDEAARSPLVSIRSEVAPLREGKQELARNAGPLTVRSLRMDSRDHRLITGFVVRPKRVVRPAPVVVMLHGKGTDASDIVVEGAMLARRGAIAIVPDNAYVRLGPIQETGLEGVRQERRRRLASAADLADIVTALRDRDDVDDRRIAVSGFSLGGYVSSLVAAELPLAAEVYVSTGAEWIQEPSLRDEPAARATITELDPVTNIARETDAQSRPRLVQLGEQDEVIGVERLERFARAVPDPKRVARYDAGHTLDVRSVGDRVEWLSQRLGL